MGAPKGNSNAAGSRRPKSKRYQNISTIVTSVLFADGRSQTLKPRMVVTLSPDDVQATKDSYAEPDLNPFDLDLVAEVPEGLQHHPDAPPAIRRLEPEHVKELFSEGSMEDVEAMIETIGDSGGLQTCHRAIIELGETFNKKREQMISGLIENRGQFIASKTTDLRMKYAALTPKR